MSAPEKWSAEKLAGATKKELVDFLQQYGNTELLLKHKLRGKAVNIAKVKKQPELVAAFEELFTTQAFRTEEDDQKEEQIKTAKEQQEQQKKEELQKKEQEEVVTPVAKINEPKQYVKETLKKGDKTNFPKAGDKVSVRYKGMLENGTIFDSNITKKSKPLMFVVGVGKVIRGWDEGLLEMSVGETAKLTIESEWAYGAKGAPPAIPPNARLIFEVELLGIH